MSYITNQSNSIYHIPVKENNLLSLRKLGCNVAYLLLKDKKYKDCETVDSGTTRISVTGCSGSVKDLCHFLSDRTFPLKVYV